MKRNCSRCERVSAINVHPLTKDVEFTQGRENMVEYRSGGKTNPHVICKLCGCFLLFRHCESVAPQRYQWTVEPPEVQSTLRGTLLCSRAWIAAQYSNASWCINGLGSAALTSFSSRALMAAQCSERMSRNRSIDRHTTIPLHPPKLQQLR